MSKINLLQVGVGVIGFKNIIYMREMGDIRVFASERFYCSELKILNNMDVPVYVADEKAAKELAKRGVKLEGIVTDLIGKVDVIDDATRDATANFELYSQFGVPVLGNGGEEHASFGTSFSSLGNFDQAFGKKKMRVVSCNTNGLVRLLAAIDEKYGLRREMEDGVRQEVGDGFEQKMKINYGVSLTRRGADPGKAGPSNYIEYSPKPSHHAKDVSDVRKDFKGISRAAVGPWDRGHLHEVTMYVKELPKDEEEFYRYMESKPRITTTREFPDKKNSALLRQYFSNMRRFDGDFPENVIVYDSVLFDRDANTISLVQWIDNASIVVPENINAVYAILGVHKNALDSVRIVDEKLKELLPGYCNREQ